MNLPCLGLAELRVRLPGAAAQQANEADGRLRRPQLIGEALGAVKGY